MPQTELQNEVSGQLLAYLKDERVGADLKNIVTLTLLKRVVRPFLDFKDKASCDFDSKADMVTQSELLSGGLNPSDAGNF